LVVVRTLASVVIMDIRSMTIMRSIPCLKILNVKDPLFEIFQTVEC
jgi:hypothetical protein